MQYEGVRAVWMAWYQDMSPSGGPFKCHKDRSLCTKTLKVALRPLYDDLIVKKGLAMWKIVNFIQHFHIFILIFDNNID
jgi:hypothetical protein